MSKKLENKTVEELEILLKEAQDEHWKTLMGLPPGLDFHEFDERMEPYNKKIGEISRALRMIQPAEFEGELDADDDIMTLDEFVENCNSGGFIDYDGSGNYIKDGKRTNIDIYPSDVKHGAIRKEFDKIVWYNR